jgi:hypothetical protein
MMDKVYQKALNIILEGELGWLEKLRKQVELICETKTTKTGHGIFIDLVISDNRYNLPIDRLVISDLSAKVNSKYLIGFNLFIQKGKIKTLEGFAFNNGWPNEFKTIEFFYDGEKTRNLEKLNSEYIEKDK